MDLDPMFVAGLVVGLLLVSGAIALVVVFARRAGAPAGSYAVVVQPGQPVPTLQGPKLDPVQAWQLAAPQLTALGMTQLDAETFMRDVGDSGETLFVTLHVRDRALRGWLDRPAPGGTLEQQCGAEVRLNPNEAGRSALEKWVAASVREVLGPLPRGACLTVKTPEMPGDSYKANLTTPFWAPDHAALVVRTLLALDLAAQRPAEGGAHAHLPPAVQLWLAAAPGLAAMGMTKLDAETYMREVGGFGKTLFIKLEVREASLRGWLDRPCPGGFPERHLRATEDLNPGESGRSELARWVAGSVREALGALPGKAHLRFTAPEIPGDSYKASLTTPLTAPDQPAIVARVLLMLDEAAQRPAGGPPAQLPPVVHCWQAAGPWLAQLGMTPLDAETYTRSFGGVTDSLYLSVNVRDATLRGWLDRRCPGGALERYLRTEMVLQPGDTGRSEIEAWVAGVVRDVLGALPRGACLRVKAPEIPGDSYRASLTTPFSSPEQASLVARVLLTLDEALRRS
jgi:hypothetical protein